MYCLGVDEMYSVNHIHLRNNIFFHILDKKRNVLVSTDLVDNVLESSHTKESLKFNDITQLVKLSYVQKLKLWISGKVHLYDAESKSTGEKISLYIINCPIHGIQLSYPSGWRKTLNCSECF